MFDISCGEDTAPGTGPSCGMFGTEPPKSEGKGLPEMTLEELLQRLDLVEYKARFNAAGITDVPTLARLTDEQLDGFDMRKLEKRKLLHHLSGVAINTNNDNVITC